MLHSPVHEIVHYQGTNGKYPFREWMTGLRDKLAKAQVGKRLSQIGSGNLGDAKSVGDGVIELRIHTGPGYRLYCGRYGLVWIVLLCGGDKSTQQQDIARAKQYWADWKRRQRSSNS